MATAATILIQRAFFSISADTFDSVSPFIDKALLKKARTSGERKTIPIVATPIVRARRMMKAK